MFDVSLHLCSVPSSIPSLPTTTLVPVLTWLPSKLEKTWLLEVLHCPLYWKRAETPKCKHCTLYCCPGSWLGLLMRVTLAWQREALGHWGSPGACQEPVLLLQDLAHTSELECAEMAHSELLCI